MRRLPAPQDRTNLSDQHEGRGVSEGHGDGDVYGAVDQQARNRDRSGSGGKRGREQPCAARGHRDGDRVGRHHARQVARAHEGREHVAGAPELDAQDGRLGGQKRNPRAHRPERAVQQQVEHHAHRGRRDARHGHLPLAAQRGQDAHRHKVADARHEAHRADDPHRRHRAGKRLAGHEQDDGFGEHQQVAHHRQADVHRETKTRAHQPVKPRNVVGHLVVRYPGHEHPRHRTDHAALHMFSFYKAQSAWR